MLCESSRESECEVFVREVRVCQGVCVCVGGGGGGGRGHFVSTSLDGGMLLRL